MGAFRGVQTAVPGDDGAAFSGRALPLRRPLLPRTPGRLGRHPHPVGRADRRGGGCCHTVRRDVRHRPDPSRGRTSGSTGPHETFDAHRPSVGERSAATPACTLAAAWAAATTRSCNSRPGFPLSDDRSTRSDRRRGSRVRTAGGGARPSPGPDRSGRVLPPLPAGLIHSRRPHDGVKPARLRLDQPLTVAWSRIGYRDSTQRLP